MCVMYVCVQGGGGREWGVNGDRVSGIHFWWEMEIPLYTKFSFNNLPGVGKLRWGQIESNIGHRRRSRKSNQGVNG